MAAPPAAAGAPVLVLGAMSDIGRALAAEYAQAGHPIVLAARDAARLEAEAQDIRLRFDVPVAVAELDVLDMERHSAFLDRLAELPDTVVCVVGLLGDQPTSQSDQTIARIVIETNFTGPAIFLAEVANRMERRGRGTIIGVSSVAGDRGRASNYVYGSAKAGFSAFLSGLRNRLAKSGVHVLTVKPGFVDTRMTAGMKLPPLLTAKPDEVARHVRRAHAKNQDVLYVRPVWRAIMTVIRALPERIFKRLSL